MGAGFICSTYWNLAGIPPQALRARCSAFRYCPSPLGIVTAKQLDELEFVELLGIVSGCTDWSIAHNKDHGVLQLL